MNAKYPEITVELSGIDGNAFSIMGAVSKALRRNGLASEVETFVAEATSGDYDNVIQTAMRWVNVT
jgi:hypothetical protein